MMDGTGPKGAGAARAVIGIVTTTAATVVTTTEDSVIAIDG